MSATTSRLTKSCHKVILARLASTPLIAYSRQSSHLFRLMRCILSLRYFWYHFDSPPIQNFLAMARSGASAISAPGDGVCSSAVDTPSSLTSSGSFCLTGRQHFVSSIVATPISFASASIYELMCSVTSLLYPGQLELQ